MLLVVQVMIQHKELTSGSILSLVGHIHSDLSTDTNTPMWVQPHLQMATIDKRDKNMDVLPRGWAPFNHIGLVLW